MPPTPPSLPCSACTGLCCGPVAISPNRLQKIREYVETLPAIERERMAAQKRDALDCGFLDMDTYRCGIYPVRPWICKAFGSVEGMQCPKVTGLVQIIPAFTNDMNFAREYESGVAASSAGFNWRKP